MSKTILIIGATGMVGREVLNHLLADETVGKIISIGRRTTGLTNDKLVEIVHDNFLDFSGLADQLTGIDVCFYCLGIYQSQVSKDRYFEITCDYQKALTDVLQMSSPNARFVLFSAQGADPSENSRMVFAKAKGRAENLLMQTEFPHKYIFRPGYIHPSGDRKPPVLGYKIMLPFLGILINLFPGLGISSSDLALAMVNTGLYSQTVSALYEAGDIKKLLKEG